MRVTVESDKTEELSIEGNTWDWSKKRVRFS